MSPGDEMCDICHQESHMSHITSSELLHLNSGLVELFFAVYICRLVSTTYMGTKFKPKIPLSAVLAEVYR
jgi:hypothetical protein